MLLGGRPLGRLDRNGPANLTVRDAALPAAGAMAELSIVVEAVGRANEGWRFDVKGLASPMVTLAGAAPRASWQSQETDCSFSLVPCVHALTHWTAGHSSSSPVQPSCLQLGDLPPAQRTACI